MKKSLQQLENLIRLLRRENLSLKYENHKLKRKIIKLKNDNRHLDITLDEYTR